MHSGLVFIIATLEIDLRRKHCGTQKGPFGDNVFKTPARYTSDFFRPRSTRYNSEVVAMNINLRIIVVTWHNSHIILFHILLHLYITSIGTIYKTQFNSISLITYFREHIW